VLCPNDVLVVGLPLRWRVGGQHPSGQANA